MATVQVQSATSALSGPSNEAQETTTIEVIEPTLTAPAEETSKEDAASWNEANQELDKPDQVAEEVKVEEVGAEKIEDAMEEEAAVTGEKIGELFLEEEKTGCEEPAVMEERVAEGGGQEVVEGDATAEKFAAGEDVKEEAPLVASEVEKKEARVDVAPKEGFVKEIGVERDQREEAPAPPVDAKEVEEKLAEDEAHEVVPEEETVSEEILEQYPKEGEPPAAAKGEEQHSFNKTVENECSKEDAPPVAAQAVEEKHVSKEIVEKEGFEEGGPAADAIAEETKEPVTKEAPSMK